MINDLSLALRELLRSVAKNEPQTFPLLQGKEIEFARPDKDYKPKANGSVCVFLYDIRENRELRSNEPLRVNRNGQTAIARPPTRVVCSYLITAWPAEALGDDLNLLEQQLLSEVLLLLSRYPTIPVDALGGKLANPEQPVPPPMITAQAEGLNNISEFWTAIGSNLRPSLNVKATIAMQVSEPKAEVKPPVEMVLRGDQPTKLEIKGQVNDETHLPIAGARIAIVELGLSTTSESNGQYAFSDVPIGKYNLSINWKADEKLKRRNLEIRVPGAPGAYDLNVLYTVAGQLMDDKVAVPGATITISQLNLSRTSDDEGKYSFESVPPGKYKVQIKWTVSGKQKSKDVEVTVPAKAVAGAYDLELKG